MSLEGSGTWRAPSSSVGRFTPRPWIRPPQSQYHTEQSDRTGDRKGDIAIELGKRCNVGNEWALECPVP
jgi:hypothetical protein